MKIFENRKVKGAISIFLIIITVPTLLFSAVLIDSSRMASAKAMAQEAADLAAISALAAYNQELKDQFGLFAVDDNEKLKEIYEESLSATLLASGLSGDAEYSEQLWDIMKTALSGQKSYMGESFLNLYDFQVDQCKVEPKYSLINPAVLENQMVEYSKFRGLYVMADRMDILRNLGESKQNAEKNLVTANVMEDKMDVDQSNAAADRELKKLREEISNLNETIKHVTAAESSYLASLRKKMEQIRIENTDTDDSLSDTDSRMAASYDINRKALKNTAAEACKQAGKVLGQAKKTKKEVETAIRRLESFQSDNQGKASGNESVESLLQDAGNNIQAYKTEYLPKIQNILDDPVLNQMKGDTGIKSSLDTVMTKIHKVITEYIEVIEQMREEMEQKSGDGGSGDEEEEDEITQYYYYYLNHSGSTVNADAALNGGSASRCYQPAVHNLIAYFFGKEWNHESLNPSNKYENVPSGKIDRSFAEAQSGKMDHGEVSLEGEAAKGTVDDAVYRARPSQMKYTPDAGKDNNTDFYNTDSDLTASKNILQEGKRSMLLDLGETMRDDTLCLTYMFGTFKTRLTGVKKFTSEGMAESERDSFYMPKWRYAHPEGELDMRFMPKKDRETVLRSEIEYLIYGNRSDTENEVAVYATIFAERLANNLIAMYADRDGINAACHVAAGVASFATLGVVPEPVFFWIFLTAWATAETIIEMEYLISGGYKIPLLKTTDNLLLTLGPDQVNDTLIDNYGKTGIFVSYEDYLLILLLIKGRDKRILRSADLIEMNMKKNGAPDFTMAKAYTYLCADTELSIRYLFGSVKPFEADYQENGLSGRMHFKNTIYLGY